MHFVHHHCFWSIWACNLNSNCAPTMLVIEMQTLNGKRWILWIGLIWRSIQRMENELILEYEQWDWNQQLVTNIKLWFHPRLSSHLTLAVLAFRLCKLQNILISLNPADPVERLFHWFFHFMLECEVSGNKQFEADGKC